MNKSKIGKSADDIFLRKPIQQEKLNTEPDAIELTSTNELLLSKQLRGRPQEHKESWSKITVVLLDKQIHWLDQLTSTIRLNTKSAVSRAEFIRAIIAAIEESEIDLSHLKNEIMIKDFILEKLKTS